MRALGAALFTAALLFATAGSAPPAAAAPGDVQAGREVFEVNCAMCHGADAAGMMGMHPSLRGAVERLTREGVEVTVRNGRDTTPPMPAFAERLTDQQTDDVVAYVASLPEGPRNFGPGEQMTDDDMMDRMMGGRDMMDGGMMGGFMV
ncbi:MAG: cytochrome c, partial [Actinobacteria bacterium]|nr:cytochrome c [Actinomycetota bacterium]